VRSLLHDVEIAVGPSAILSKSVRELFTVPESDGFLDGSWPISSAIWCNNLARSRA
jgi:hypothetical protein